MEQLPSLPQMHDARLALVQTRLRQARAHERAARPDDAIRALRSAIRLLAAAGRARALVHALVHLGRLLIRQGRYRDAAPLLRRAVRRAEAAFRTENLTTALALNEYGVCCKHLAQFATAGEAYQRAYQIVRRRLGPRHPDLATIFHNLGGLEHAAGNGLRGEPFARAALRLRTRMHGRSHAAVADDLAALAALLDLQGKYRESEPLYRRALTIYERTHGAEHPALLATVNNLAAVLQATRRPRQAEVLYRRALRLARTHLPPTHPRIASGEHNLATLLLARGRLREADALCRRALTTLRRQLGDRHPVTARCMQTLAGILRKRRRRVEAGRLDARASRALARVDAVRPNGTAATATINPLRARYPLRVSVSRLHRFGVFTDQAIPARQRVIEYTGEFIGLREATRRWDPAQSYLFEIDAYWTIDGAVGGSGAEFINHSCAPNLVTRQRGRRIFYFAKRRIAKGEELTVDYKYDADLAPMPCHCGADTCRGTMNRAATG